MKELKYVMCVAEAESNKANDTSLGRKQVLGNAYVVYQGSTMCKRHMFGMVRAQMAQQQSRIAVPQVKGKVSLT